ncbi:hypothetical protein FCH28_09605 [Streptomyces piniterrae]|uniref:Uncharacterized protein n=1 Tax=Streptomyces piniterrae TaxID=2571125 RepID=A0A4U0NMF3_9ACTN|nr:hypothetical protein [Streptomyces piniterrae]TJZ55586.1 hypothetical protein FCH28_09605 [Streptomyces piniterrae]
MTGRPQRITGALYVDTGQEVRSVRWIKPPRARYECLLCRTVEGPVTGAEAVARFVATIRTDHPTRCTANYKGVQAA